jgi:hypothetical protein
MSSAWWGVIGEVNQNLALTTEEKPSVVVYFLLFCFTTFLLVCLYAFQEGTFPFNAFVASLFSSVGSAVFVGKDVNAIHQRSVGLKVPGTDFRSWLLSFFVFQFAVFLVLY